LLQSLCLLLHSFNRSVLPVKRRRGVHSVRLYLKLFSVTKRRRCHHQTSRLHHHRYCNRQRNPIFWPCDSPLLIAVFFIYGIRSLHYKFGTTILISSGGSGSHLTGRQHYPISPRLFLLILS